jgi:hypothetical protein
VDGWLIRERNFPDIGRHRCPALRAGEYRHDGKDARADRGRSVGGPQPGTDIGSTGVTVPSPALPGQS